MWLEYLGGYARPLKWGMFDIWLWTGEEQFKEVWERELAGVSCMQASEAP